MFNSRTPAPNSLLLSRKECRSCVVFLMQDHSSRRVYACLAFPYPNKSRQTTTAACREGDRKSTRLNSSHGYISYAVFCLKKKKNMKVYAPPKYGKTSLLTKALFDADANHRILAILLNLYCVFSIETLTTLL